MKGSILLFGAIGSLVGCSKSQVDLESAEATLLAAAEKYHQVSHASDWVKLTESEAEDILILPPNGEAIHGVKAAREFFEATPAGLEIQYEAPIVQVSRSGDMGYSLAKAFVRSTTPEGTMVEDEVRDFHLWTKQDGEWRIAIDMWNSTSP